MKKFEATTLLLVIAFWASAQKLKPALNLVKGSTYSLLIKQRITTNQTIKQLPLETRMILAAKMSFKVSDIQNDHYSISANYDTINLRMELPNGNLQYSSERSDSANVYSQLLAAFKGKPFLISLSKSGKTLTTNEADSCLSALSKQLLTVNTAQREQAFRQLQQSIGNNAVINILDNLLYIFPASTVNKTDKWIIENKAPGEPSLTVRNFYFITNSSATGITIQGNGTVQSESATDTSRLNGMPVKRSLAGTTTSLITINKKTGWPVNAEVTQSLKGNLIIQDNPKLPGGIAIPVIITSSLTATAL